MKKKKLPLILLIDNYDSFTYNLYQNLSELGAKVKVIRNDKISLLQIQKLNPNGIVISPGPGNPDSAGISLEIVKQLSGKFPIFGVCLGHQTIAQAFGGKVIRAKKLFHGKTSPIVHKKKEIYEGVLSPFTVARYHSLIVERKSLPKCLEVTSETEDGVIMGLRHKFHKTYGVQFHPESFASQTAPQSGATQAVPRPGAPQTNNNTGKRLLKNFIEVLA